MKKIFTTILVLCTAWSMQAALHLSYNNWVGEDLETVTITQDTTIVVTEYEYDEDMEEATMEVRGKMYSDESENITVTITRQITGIIDQFCAAGNCISGNKELTQVCEFTIGQDALKRSWFTHYTPLQAGVETIIYTFDDGVNPAIKLTIKYSYLMTAVEDVVAPQYNGKIYNMLGQEMPATELSELPAGIYIINGKKYSKQ